jgi:hypothetical protein
MANQLPMMLATDKDKQLWRLLGCCEHLHMVGMKQPGGCQKVRLRTAPSNHQGAVCRMPTYLSKAPHARPSATSRTATAAAAAQRVDQRPQLLLRAVTVAGDEAGRL